MHNQLLSASLLFGLVRNLILLTMDFVVLFTLFKLHKLNYQLVLFECINNKDNLISFHRNVTRNKSFTAKTKCNLLPNVL